MRRVRTLDFTVCAYIISGWSLRYKLYKKKNVYNLIKSRNDSVFQKILPCSKGGLISQGISFLVPLPIIGAKSLPWAENLNKLFTVMGQEIKFFCSSAQGSNLAPFVGNGTKIKIPSEIKPPLIVKVLIWILRMIP